MKNIIIFFLQFSLLGTSFIGCNAPEQASASPQPVHEEKDKMEAAHEIDNSRNGKPRAIPDIPEEPTFINGIYS